MTALRDLLARQIATEGPMNLADYMQTCLLHPEHGYYATRDPFGTAGDFITSPEISQMFGELLGLCLAQAWMDQGRPAAYLAELGPGRGTLMKDVLRVTAQIEGFPRKVVLVEASAHLRDVQAKTLVGADVTWVDHVTDLPDGPVLLVANEFFDALPIRQFMRGASGWRERHIGLDRGALAFGLTGETRIDALSHRLADTGADDVVEICPSAGPIVEDIAARVAKGGAALIIDYGDWRSLGDTFQALENHASVDPLSRPGQADLTAHVDFEALSKAAGLCQASEMTPQGVFLERLGITPRAQALARNLQAAALDAHIAAHRRLTHPEEMGSLFKAIALAPKGAPLPPGFDPARSI
ncbi:class I SAM-dependent methyltransferase [Litoreibacter janthinus]|uniref:SAM-dependent methyltransferase, MidA family n=1 Tax=Litoreibacter janthinus TaxID=670154 RepID=A0A1I6GGX2_9RHOB|nr:SAM-dependent methyltransferase [Litoreibacter janthinus]SFR41442.1 SAM-dependent methyltransferase, MidA family [Litoreibacter janthinus]